MKNYRRWIRLVALLAAASLVAAACGGDDDDVADDSAAAANVDPNGVMRIGFNLAPTAVFFDLTTQVAVPNVWHPMIFDTLLRRTPEGDLVPGLAKEVKIVDPSTLTVELNAGMKFSDGTPVDSASVKFSIERNITKGKAGSFEVELFQLDTITVNSPTTFTIKLKSPIAGAWYRLLSLAETSPISPTAAQLPGVDFNQKPVGAGPFMLQSFKAEDNITLVKNPTYFQADKIRLAGITFVHVTPQAIGNSVRSKTVDMYANMPYSDATQLQGLGLQVQINTTDNVMVMGHMCKSRPPFNDLRVRQALNYAIDRKGLNALFDGKGEDMVGFFKKGSPFHDATLEKMYTRDLAKAKSLLAAAGVPNLTFKMHFPAGADGTRLGEVVQAQLKEAGITVELTPLSTTNDFFPEAKSAPINFFPLNRSGLLKVTRVYVPGSFGNVCTWDDPELNRLVKELQAVQEDSPEGIKLWKQIQKHSMETAVTVFGIFGVHANVWDGAKLGDVDFRFISTTPVPDFYNIYVKK